MNTAAATRRALMARLHAEPASLDVLWAADPELFRALQAHAGGRHAFAVVYGGSALRMAHAFVTDGAAWPPAPGSAWNAAQRREEHVRAERAARASHRVPFHVHVRA